jgi:hypothetical protein
MNFGTGFRTLKYVMFVEAAIWIPYFVLYTFKCCITYSSNNYSTLFYSIYSILFLPTKL